MPIKPIDLQTLFMQMGQVGREKAVERDAVTMQQALQGNLAVRKQEEEAKTVRRLDEDQSGAGAIRPDGGKPSEGGGQEGQKDTRGEDTADRETVTDPNLGKHVDISG